MDEFYAINRYALLLRPSAAMIEWVNTLYPDDPMQHSPQVEHDEVDVFLIPEMADVEDAEDWLKDNYQPFLSQVLDEWTPEPTDWPQDLSWATFDLFFEWSIHESVTDTVSKEDDEEYDDDFDDDDDEISGEAAEDDDVGWN